MASPVADTYSCLSSGVIYAGMRRYGILSTTVSAMPSGSWLDWSASTNVQAITDTTAPDGATAWLESTANYFLTNWPGKATFDDARKQIVLVGTTQGYASETPVGTHSSAVYLDVTTGQFSKQWNPMARNLAHQYDGNCSISLNGKVYRKPYNVTELFECDLATRVWTLKKSLTSLVLDAVTNIDVFPDLGASGSVMFLTGGGKLCRYDIATDTLSTIGTYSGIGQYGWIHYCTAGHYVVFGSGTTSTSIYKCDSSGTVSLITSTLPGGLTATGAGAGVPVVPDPEGQARSWAFGTNAWSLDHAAGTWTDHGALPGGLAISNACVSAIHGQGCFVFLEGAGRASSTVSNSQVWLFKA